MRNSRAQFFNLLAFLCVVVLALSNGFAARIFAEPATTDVFQTIEPISEVLDHIMREYVSDPDLNKVVEGALAGMMQSLDRHSSFLPPSLLQEVTEDTEGEFFGVGISIKLNEEGFVSVFQAIIGTPASKAGIMGGDIILEIDGQSTEGMALDKAASLIKGPKGTEVHLKIFRPGEGGKQGEVPEYKIKRDKIPMESISEARLIENKIAYIRVTDFKKNTSQEIKEKTEDLMSQGASSLILDLRWNPGGLLNASREVCELFLPKNTLVTYTRGRQGRTADDMELYTTRKPVVPETFPIMILVSDLTASSSEIVTGALQFWARAIVVGEKTYGKGSVQTIIPLRRPANSALRLTTALYYTPADVTIHERGIIPDVEVAMSREEQGKLIQQMYRSYEDDAGLKNDQNHGTVTGAPGSEELIEDLPLKRAVEILNEDPVFANLIRKYHRDPRDTQVAALKAKEGGEAPDAAANVAAENNAAGAPEAPSVAGPDAAI